MSDPRECRTLEEAILASLAEAESRCVRFTDGESFSEAEAAKRLADPGRRTQRYAPYGATMVQVVLSCVEAPGRDRVYFATLSAYQVAVPESAVGLLIALLGLEVEAWQSGSALHGYVTLQGTRRGKGAAN